MIGYGKICTFEVLISERAITRIWCTSIFSSEKFYILLKGLKSKEFSLKKFLEQFSQLTYGASHQGIALQLALKNNTSKKLVENSKNKSANPIIVALDGITDPHNVGAIINQLSHLIVMESLFLKEDLLD